MKSLFDIKGVFGSIIVNLIFATGGFFFTVNRAEAVTKLEIDNLKAEMNCHKIEYIKFQDDISVKLEKINIDLVNIKVGQGKNDSDHNNISSTLNEIKSDLKEIKRK